MKYTQGILLPALLGLASLGAAKKDEPLVAEQAFESELVNIFYFDDSDVALAAELDSLDVWRSADAGKTWKKQEDMKTLGIEKSPFDNNVAVVLGDRTHWITYDQGEKWTKFETEYPPSLGQPLSFHATDNKKILYHTIEDCFVAPCLGQVSRARQFQAASFMANTLCSRSTPPMDSSRNRKLSSTIAKCACGQRALSFF